MEEKKNFKQNKKIRNDIFLVIIIFAISLAIFSIFKFSGKKGEVAEVSVDGKVIASYSLAKDTTVTISEKSGQENRLVIENGFAKIDYATCPDKICQKHKKISKTNETIVCLPHKLVVKIVSEKQGVDMVG